MDIRDKLLETVDSNDPQFKTLLHNAIQAEIQYLERTLAAKRSLNEIKRLELKHLLERRKELKKSIKQKTEMLPIMEKASEHLRDYSIKLFEEMTLVQNMVDPESLHQLYFIEEEKKLLEKLEKKCIEYEAEFEKDPQAQELKKVKQGLLKIEVEILMREQNIKDMEESYKLYEDIEKKREQQQIIAIAEIYVKYRDHLREWKSLKEEHAKLNTILDQQENQIQSFMAEQKDKDKQNLMARIQMPPPVMDTKFVETIFPSSQLLSSEMKNPDTHNDDFSDNVSMCSSVLEDMCNSTENLNIITTESERVEIEPDVISLASNDDSQYTEDVNSIRSLQTSPAIFSRNPYNPCVRKIAKKLTETGKQTGKSPRVQRHKTVASIPENESQSDRNPEGYAANLGAIKKTSRVNPTSKRNRNEVSNPKNVPSKEKNTDQYSAKSGATKKVKTTAQSGEFESYTKNANANEIFDFPEDSVTMETDVLSENHSVAGSVNSFHSINSNIQQKDTDTEFHSDISIQSFTNDQNNSGDENSDADNEDALTEQNSPPTEPPASTPFGIFSSQNKTTFNFKGSLFK